MVSTLRTITACAAALLTTTALGGTPPSYHIEDIGGQINELQLSSIAHLNENGDGVGEILLNSVTQGIVATYEHGPILLSPLGGFSTSRGVEATDRDENGEIVIIGTTGFSSLDPTNTTMGVGCYWRYSTVSGTITESGLIGPLAGGASSRANGINNDGIVVGWSRAGGIAGPFTPIKFDVNTGSLEPMTFPALPVDINNVGQVAGGTYIGDTMGNATNIGIPATSTSSASISAINDQGWVSATVTRTFTDGAGRFVKGAARYDGAWRIIWSNSAFDSGADINENGDLVGLLGISAAIRPAVFFDDINEVHLVNSLLGPMEVGSFSAVNTINSNKQLGVGFRAAVLTPLGQMIIPGDVNGDAEVMPDDLCDWLANPIDLDGDGDADADDEMFLIDLLELLGFPIDDCNGNGVPDPCDILNGVSNDCNGNFVPDECEPDCDGDGIPDGCESDCNENGIPDDCDIADGTSEDCNGNGIPDECDASDTVIVLNSYDPPVTLFSNLPHTDELLVTTAGTIQDVDFHLDVNFRVGQVTARLTHDGVTVTLIDRPGETPQNPLGFTNLGYRITLDDEGAGANIQNVGAPFSEFEFIESPPSYRPASPLSAFDGLPREGVWTLELELGIAQTFDPALLSWGVSVTDTEIPVGECVCEGDCDDSGAVDFDDLICMLFQFQTGSSTAGADCDNSGTVDFNDLICALFAFGNCN